MTERKVITACAKAIVALDQGAFGLRDHHDEEAIREARQKLLDVLRRNNYELVEPGSPRVRKVPKQNAPT